MSGIGVGGGIVKNANKSTKTLKKKERCGEWLSEPLNLSLEVVLPGASKGHFVVQQLPQ